MRRIPALFEVIIGCCAYVLPITDQCQDYWKIKYKPPGKNKLG